MASARVGFVGAGRMGLPMVEWLAAADTDLLALARRAEARDTLGTSGVRTWQSAWSRLASAALTRGWLLDVVQRGELALT